MECADSRVTQNLSNPLAALDSTIRVVGGFENYRLLWTSFCSFRAAAVAQDRDAGKSERDE